MIGNDLLNHIIIEKGVQQPGEILSRLSNGIKSVFTREGMEQQAQDGMDMVLCAFEKDLSSVEFAGAKNPLLLVHNGELNQFKGDKFPIGGETELNYTFTNHQINLREGVTVYLMSDGYPDQFGGPKGKKFMIKRFKELVVSIKDENMDRQKEILIEQLESWKGELEQVDDICVIGIRV